MLRHWYNLVNLALILVVLWFGMNFYRQLTEEPPVQFHPPGSVDDPFTVGKAEYRVGESVTFRFERCVDYPLEFAFTQSFRNLDTDVVYHIDSLTITETNPGCQMVESLPKLIPPRITPGDRYRMEFGVSVEGKYRSFIIPVLTNEFKILPAEEGAIVEDDMHRGPQAETVHIERIVPIPSPAASVAPTVTPTPPPTPAPAPEPSRGPQGPPGEPGPKGDPGQPAEEKSLGDQLLDTGDELLDSLL